MVLEAVAAVSMDYAAYSAFQKSFRNLSETCWIKTLIVPSVNLFQSWVTLQPDLKPWPILAEVVLIQEVI